MICKKCGKQMDDKAAVCPHCGASAENSVETRGTAPVANDAPNTGFAVLCGFFPIIGLILFLLWRGTTPLRARSCGKGAIIGMCVWVALIVIWLIIALVMNARISS